MTPLFLTGWGARTALGDAAGGFARLCAGATGVVAAAEAGLPWLDAAAGLALAGPVGAVPGAAVELLDVLLAGVRVDGEGLAVVLATTGGASPDGEREVGAYVRREPLANPAALWWENLPHHLAEAVARRFGATGPVLVVSTACTSGTVAVGVAADLLAADRARRALVVGVDVVCRSSLFGFRSLGVHSAAPCRPFDLDRDGMNVGGGAAWVLVEGPTAADRRFELLGVGVAQDAAHLTAPDPAGAGLARAITVALAGVPADRVDHVNAHGTATVPNDAAEAAVLPHLLPRAAVSATKGATGHTLGAAGVVELVLLLQSMEAGRVPPVAGLTRPIPGVDVAPAVRDRPQEVGVSVNLAFGGHNAAVAVRRRPSGASPPSPASSASPASPRPPRPRPPHPRGPRPRSPPSSVPPAPGPWPAATRTRGPSPPRPRTRISPPSSRPTRRARRPSPPASGGG